MRSFSRSVASALARVRAIPSLSVAGAPAWALASVPRRLYQNDTSKVQSVLDIQPDDPVSLVIQKMKDARIRRAHLLYNRAEHTLAVSHPLLSSIARNLLADKRDFRSHEAIFLELGKNTDRLFAAVIHNTVRGPAAGGVRCWHYDTFEDLLKDGLRLSQGMSHKNALAGLWFGGGQAIVAGGPNGHLDERSTTFKDFGRFVTSLQGCYVTAKDMGVSNDDMATVFAHTRFTTCVPVRVGGSGDPSLITGRGVVSGMEAALEHLGFAEGLKGRSVAVMGAGKVGRAALAALLDKQVRRVVISDTSLAAIQDLRASFADAPVEFRHVAPRDVSILAEDVDVLSPCAVGGVLNPLTIPSLKAKVIAGGANNQLLDPVRDGRLLAQRKIAYVPDFLCNRMGIVSCANEDAGTLINDPAVLRHLDRDYPQGIYQTTRAVLDRAARENVPTGTAAAEMAEELMRESHPLWPERGKQIIASLAQHGWCNNF